LARRPLRNAWPSVTEKSRQTGLSRTCRPPYLSVARAMSHPFASRPPSQSRCNDPLRGTEPAHAFCRDARCGDHRFEVPSGPRRFHGPCHRPTPAIDGPAAIVAALRSCAPAILAAAESFLAPAAIVAAAARFVAAPAFFAPVAVVVGVQSFACVVAPLAAAGARRLSRRDGGRRHISARATECGRGARRLGVLIPL
jgi:hypothetical protein